MTALGGLALLGYGAFIGFVVGCGVGWLTRHREDETADSLLEVHNQRLRVKNRRLHESVRALEVERAQLCAEREVLLDALACDENPDFAAWDRQLEDGAA